MGLGGSAEADHRTTAAIDGTVFHPEA